MSEVDAMIRAAIFVVTIFIASPFAHGLGTDYAPGPVEGSSAWPKNTLALVNSGERVGGFWVNQCDSFFYRGDAAALNEFIKQYSLIDGTPLKLVLHAGAKPLTGKLAEKPTIPSTGRCKSIYGVGVRLKTRVSKTRTDTW